LRAIEEADRVLFLLDAREGLTPADRFVADILRRSNKTIILVTNKAEGLDSGTANADFYQLGLGEPQAISAAHSSGLDALVARALEGIQLDATQLPDDRDRISVAVIGRPNVGKSTLINRLLGEERVVTFDQPGTTRDSVFIPFERDGREYTLIDTAGVRRRARVEEVVEKYSVIKALQAIESANVVIGVIDAHDTVAEQDASLFGMAAERGRALVIAVNKWDGIPMDKRDEIRTGLDLKLPFLEFAPVHFISALHGTGVGELMRSVSSAYDAAMREMPTPELTRVLEQAIQQHQPPLVRGRRIKLRYAHQGGRNPPIIVIHGNQIKHVPDAYARYLMGVYRRTFHLEGTPVRIEFRSDDNPFAGKRNPLTPRQRRKRQRLIKRNKR
jgi:GTP-binding protein